MTRLLWRLRRKWETYRYQQWYSGDENRAVSYALWKKTLAAAVIFGIVYSIHQLPGVPARYVDKGVQYILNKEMDLTALKEKLAGYNVIPRNFDLAVFRNLPAIAVQSPAGLNLPVEGQIISPYGWRAHPVTKRDQFHEGIDIAAPEGTPVKAAAAGKVTVIAESNDYGKMVIVSHGEGTETVYAHLLEITVKQGDRVSRGQPVGKVGRTGNAESPHLHFEVKVNGQPVDPLTRIRDSRRESRAPGE